MDYNGAMSDNDSYTPDWVPKDAGDAFTVKIRKGIETKSTVKKIPHKPQTKRAHLTIDDYVNGVLNNDKILLARTITLIESNSTDHYDKAREVLTKLKNSGLRWS